VPQGARGVFTLLEEADWLDKQLSQSLKNRVGFRNIAVHGYQELQLPITVAIINKHSDDFLVFSQTMLLKSA
jgi:uncharacterized protein YutE (UPF0331/DUF86 family)